MDQLNITIVDTPSAVRDMVDKLDTASSSGVQIFVDIEGIELSRYGSISIVQLYFLPLDNTFLLDVHVLKTGAFDTAGSDGMSTVRTILESNTTAKAFFDVRNDSDALFSHYNVRLAGVVDIQLMELATRSLSRRLVNGLARCIEKDALMSYTERTTWQATKHNGRRLFAPELGGRYEVFNDRPMKQEIVEYCAQDVRFLPRLLDLYEQRISSSWKAKVESATADRIALSQSANYNGKGRHMALAPSGWA